MPEFRQLTLPSGAVARLCAECADQYPRHQYFCSAVREYSRSTVLRELVRVDDEMTRLKADVAATVDDAQLERDMRTAYGKDGLSGTGVRTPAMRKHSQLFLLREEFWAWAWWIGLEIMESTSASRADLLAEVADMRARTTLKRTLDSEDAAA